MTKFLIATLISAVSISAAANDQYKKAYTCELAQPNGKYEITLAVYHGGISGIPQIKLMRETMAGQRTIRTYMAPIENQGQRPRPGAPRVYRGKEISLSINLTVAPRRDSKRLATLVTKEFGTQALICKAINYYFAN